MTDYDQKLAERGREVRALSPTEVAEVVNNTFYAVADDICTLAAVAMSLEAVKWRGAALRHIGAALDPLVRARGAFASASKEAVS